MQIVLPEGSKGIIASVPFPAKQAEEVKDSTLNSNDIVHPLARILWNDFSFYRLNIPTLTLLEGLF